MSSGGFLRRSDWHVLADFLHDADCLCGDEYVERAVEVTGILARSVQRARGALGPVSYAGRELELWGRNERRESWLLER